MGYSATLFGLEIGFYPALFLLVPLLLGATLGVQKVGAVVKGWSGHTSPLQLQPRIIVPRLFFFLCALCIVLALSDITRRYTVAQDQYATNRLYTTLDNSSSMYGFDASGPPIHCTDKGLKRAYPRIFNACRAMFKIIDAMEAYVKKKNDGSQDKIGLLRFGLFSFVELYGSTDYERARTLMREINWRDPRTGIYTEYHLALWDMFQVALQKNFRRADGVVPLDDGDRRALALSLYPESGNTRYAVPRALKAKLEGLRADLKDTAFIIITDAHEGQFEGRLHKSPVSLIKMMQLAEFIELPIYIISIYRDHEVVRKLAEKTGSGPVGGPNRGAFYLLKGEQNFEDMDAIVEKILSARFRVVSTAKRWERESYTSLFASISFLCLLLGLAATLSPFGRTIGKGGIST
ncbi:MAG TPA: hypothetical protein VJH33_00215 [Candidatus Paceibacterota bacterium]